jgi:short-subunit dehydrogenase
MPLPLQGQTALVTGASSGLGADFARELAGRGASLVLAARRRERLEQLAQELRERHGVTVHVQTVDLSEPDAGRALKAELDARGLHIDILVNNAGLAAYGPFFERDWADHQKLLQVDVVALTELTHAFVPAMSERGRGHVLLVASVLGYVPAPGYASYAAAKAYVRHFGDVLAYELRGTGVAVTVVSPGSTATEFFDVGGQRLSAFQRASIMPSHEVARLGTRAMLSRRVHLIPGFFNWLQVHLARLVPAVLRKRVAQLLLGA